MRHTRIAVIESNWWRKSNVSVRGLFELIANIACENPNAFHYEMANSRSAMKEAIPRIGSYRECRYLYIATHGDEHGLSLLNGDSFPKRTLRDCLVQIRKTPQSRLRGLHLGSCLFATNSLASYLFHEDVGINWIAGYSEEVDWLQSSALDLLFFNELMKFDDSAEVRVIRSVAEEICRLARSLSSELGFGIFARKSGGGILNLLEDTGTTEAINI